MLPIILITISILQSVSGRVVDGELQPISLVNADSMPTDYTKTADDGSFELTNPSELIRFWRPGYKPVTKQRSAVRTDPVVVLEPSDESQWRPPQCSSEVDSPFGPSWAFQYPSDLSRESWTEQQHGIRYERSCVGEDCMLHFAGPMSTFGVARVEDLVESVDLIERDVFVFRSEDIVAYEYRGVKADGSHWRMIGTVEQEVGYDGVNPEVAQVFDAVIDSLCIRTTRR